MFADEEHRPTVIVETFERCLEAFFKLETVRNDEHGVVDRLEIFGRRLELVGVLPVGNDRYDIGDASDKFTDD